MSGYWRKPGRARMVSRGSAGSGAPSERALLISTSVRDTRHLLVRGVCVPAAQTEMAAEFREGMEKGTLPTASYEWRRDNRRARKA
ncbi:hypothetical protein Shyhy01_70630 [Streptomyces hygroscopicus subsp. hygroscopicus]|nr:hypothetical protein Shyhy01_70630 [Streptomyces hygroscopicus subsp. hygroscopicus]